MANYKSKTLMPEHQEEGKKKISPEYIHKSLLESVKAELYAGLIVSGIILLFIIFLCGMFEISNEFFMLKEPWDKVIYLCLFLIPIVVVIILLFIYKRDINRITSGNYSIITDDVQSVVTDDKMVKRGRSSTMEHAMYLYKCGRQVISLEQTYTISEGDIYYAVVYNDKPDKAIFLYNSKFYELEDIEEE